MTITNGGTLEVLKDGKATTDKAVAEKVKDALDEHGVSMSYGGPDVKIVQEGTVVEFTEYPGSFLDSDLNDVLRDLEPDGISLRGDLEYWGDYDGYILVDETGARSIDKEQYGLERASDETLIGILEKRGYIVAKADSVKPQQVVLGTPASETEVDRGMAQWCWTCGNDACRLNRTDRLAMCGHFEHRLNEDMENDKAYGGKQHEQPE